MPYISTKNDRREKLREGQPALTAGELNYKIFYTIKHSINIYTIGTIESSIKISINQFLGKKPSYQKYNDMTGCLIRCYKEIKRRLGIDVKKMFVEIMESYDDEIDKYEDKKIIYYGDVE